MAVLPTGIGPVTGGYQIERSLRFNRPDSSYLNRTPTSAGNRKTWTWSGWVKRSKLGTNYTNLFGVSNSGSNAGFNVLTFGSNGVVDTLGFQQWTSTYRTTTQVFRDVGGWLHIVCVLDTTQATGADRVKLYVNGSQITAFSTSSDPTQNSDLVINSNVLHSLGRDITQSVNFDGYMTEVYFIDGQALTPSSFGETDSSTGVWKPKAYSGTYGTNGFYLKFADNSGTTSTTLGKDSSGNGNNWTPNNFSVTAGAGNDSLVDSPTSYGTDTGVGGEVRGNYCTFNPLNANSAITLSNGNLTITQSNNRFCGTTIPVASGKWYFEYLPANTGTGNSGIGVIRASDNVFGSDAFSAAGSYAGVGYLSSGNKNISGTITSYGATYVSGDVIGVAIDLDSGTQTITFYKNNTSQGSINIPTASQTWMVVCDGATSVSANINFGQRAFAYTAPSGFKALCTQNLTTPTIGATSTTQANKYFNVKLWTGNGSTQSITGIGFQPDLVWTKDRGAAFDHTLFDAVRGATIFLRSNATSADETRTDSLTSFNSDGFSVGADAVRNNINKSAASYVSWAWDANGAGSTNTAGTITSTVSANTTSGFSIVTYTGTGAQGTMGHGLGVVPSLIIQKNRAQASNWLVYHSSLGLSHTTYPNWLYLNSTAGEQNSVSSTNHPLYQRPSSSLIYLNTGTSELTNVSGQNHVAYCFAPVAGYSAFGSYTGNGSTTDGPFVYLGFRPRFILLKGTDASVRRWCIVDTARSTYNTSGLRIYAELPNAEDVGGGSAYDIVSNGFKLRDADGNFNASGVTYIYAAFAESPFKYSLAR